MDLKLAQNAIFQCRKIPANHIDPLRVNFGGNELLFFPTFSHNLAKGVADHAVAGIFCVMVGTRTVARNQKSQVFVRPAPVEQPPGFQANMRPGGRD